MTNFIDKGSKDNRGRTSPSIASAGSPPGGATRSGETKRLSQTAVTVVRRIGHVANVALGALVSEAINAGDGDLASMLATQVGPIVDDLVHFTFDEQAIPDVSEEG